MEFKLKPIGVIHSPIKRNEEIDVKKFADPQGFDQIQGELEIFNEYEEGLKDTEGEISPIRAPSLINPRLAGMCCANGQIWSCRTFRRQRIHLLLRLQRSTG
jgi:hypothetical protein